MLPPTFVQVLSFVFFLLPFKRTYNFTTASGYKQYQPLRITDNTMEKTETTLRSPAQYSGRCKSGFTTTPTH